MTMKAHAAAASDTAGAASDTAHSIKKLSAHTTAIPKGLATHPRRSLTDHVAMRRAQRAAHVPAAQRRLMLTGRRVSQGLGRTVPYLFERYTSGSADLFYVEFCVEQCNIIASPCITRASHDPEK